MTNNTMPSDIERTVMRRVRTAHALRPIVSTGALAALVCVLALWGIGQEVWVAHVFQNAPNAGLVSLARFYLAAFEHTQVAVQLLVLAGVAGALLFARSLAGPVARVFAPAY